MRWRREHIAAAVLLVLGLLLRASLWTQWRPAFTGFSDEAGYLGDSQSQLLSAALRPPGYPVVLHALRLLWDHLGFLTAVQHLAGLGAAAMLWRAALRAGAGRWAALVPAAVVALQGTTIFLEHAILAETVLLALISAALLLALDGRLVPALLAGAAAGAAGTVRTVAIPLVGILALWLLWAAPGALRRRAAIAAGCLAAGAVFVLANLLAAHHATGAWSFARNDAYQSYGRVANFVDCRPSVFKPPTGTEILCPLSDTHERQGHDFWLYDNRSPLVAQFGHPSDHHVPPERLALINRFVRAAILGQPKAYLRVVGRDLVRLVDPDFPQNPTPFVGNAFAGYTPDALVTQLEDPRGEDVPDMFGAPAGGRVETGAMGFAHWWERHTRLTGVPMVILLLLAAAGPLLGGGRLRRGAALAAATAALLLVLPILVSSYDWRYVVPALPVLALAAALGADALRVRISER